MASYTALIIVIGFVAAFGLALASFRQFKPQPDKTRLLIFLSGILGGKHYTKKGQLQMILSVIVLVLTWLVYYISS